MMFVSQSKKINPKGTQQGIVVRFGNMWCHLRASIQSKKQEKLTFHLDRSLPSEWFSQSHFLAKAHNAHYSTVTGGQAMPTVIYSFVVMADMHVAIDAFDSVARVPMSFFSTRQRCYAGSPDHQNLARDIHAEFGPLFGRKIPKAAPTSKLRPSGLSSKLKRLDSPHNEGPIYKERKSSYTDTDTSSENGLVDKVEPIAVHTSQVHDADSEADNARRDNFWGGIMVNSEMTIQNEGRLDSSYSNNREFGANAGLGLQTAVSTAKEEDTFVEELMSVTRAKFIPPKPGY
jgi:hypothetical protein